MSTISAGTTTGTALVSAGDTTGTLVLQTNGTTTALTLGTNQAATFAGNLVYSKAVTEGVFALGTSGSIALNPANGTIQTCALAGNPTFTDSLAAGQSLALRLNNGASYTVTWPTMTWVTSGGNAAPTLTAADTLVFWKIGTTLYGAYVGSFE
jgi:hypothetical protein